MSKENLLKTIRAVLPTKNRPIDVAFGRFLTLVEIILMVVLGGVKGLGRPYLGCNLVTQSFCGHTEVGLKELA